MQIVQFVIDLFVVYFGSAYLSCRALRYLFLTTITAYEHTAAKYFPDTLPHIDNCAGSEDAAAFGCVLLTIYLGLFINFYFQTYKKPEATRKVAANVNIVSNGKANGIGSVIKILLVFSAHDAFSGIKWSETVYYEEFCHIFTRAIQILYPGSLH